MSLEFKSNSRIGAVLFRRIGETNSSIAAVSAKVGATYEHIRSIVRGNSIPSRSMVAALAEALKLDGEELERIATADRIRLKFGRIPYEIAGKNPELEPLERIWSQLSEEHKGDLIAQAQVWAERDLEKAKKKQKTTIKTT